MLIEEVRKMNEFDRFIRPVLNDRGINEEDKKELDIELRDHLNCLKKDFIEKGHNEAEANKLAIKEFGEVNALGNTLKRYLVSKNKVRTLTNDNKIKGILVMLITYFITTLFYTIVINQPLVDAYNVLVAFVSVASIYILNFATEKIS